jgi:flagellar motor switch protein FliN/FliY
VEVTSVSSVTIQELLGGLDAPWVFVEVGYQRGLTGMHWLVLSQRNALALAGETDVVDLEATHQQTIRDTVNQLLLAAGPPLMPLFARSVVYAPATVHLVSDQNLSGDLVLPGDLRLDQRLWVARAQASGENVAFEMVLTIDEALARDIAALGEPAPAPSDAPQQRGGETGPSKIDLILDVTLPVAVELGRARMQIQDILKLAPGSVIALDKSAGDPVELFINDRAIAKGEVVIIDENFGVRLTSIVTASERIRTLR